MTSLKANTAETIERVREEERKKFLQLVHNAYFIPKLTDENIQKFNEHFSTTPPPEPTEEEKEIMRMTEHITK